MKNFLKLSVTIFLFSVMANVIAKPYYTIDEKMYAEHSHVSLNEAKRVMIFGQNQEWIMEKIQTKYKGRIAGTYIENVPHYKLVVRLVGTGKDTKKYFPIKNHKNLYLPVELKYGAKVTKEVGLEQMAKAELLASRYFDTVRMTSYNEKTGGINIEIKAKPTPDVLAKIEQLKQDWHNPDLPLNIELVNYDIVPL